MIKETFKLRNDVQIPSIGFGTWQTPSGETAVAAVKCALESGYTHIDTAAAYNNEKSVGQAIAESGIERNKLFVTSKLWNSSRGYDKTLRAFDKSLKDLSLEYLDLYLIHWPAAKGADWQKVNNETWRAMEELYKTGKIKAIGVSNFLPHHLQPLIDSAEIFPAVNQIEYHPGQMQQETVQFCRDKDIIIEAWSPLGTGKMLTNPQLMEIAKHYQKSVAQLCIRWCLQNDVLPLPKSVTPERIIENREVFDFEISDEDMKTINEMPYIGGSGLNPDTINF